MLIAKHLLLMLFVMAFGMKITPQCISSEASISVKKAVDFQTLKTL